LNTLYRTNPSLILSFVYFTHQTTAFLSFFSNGGVWEETKGMIRPSVQITLPKRIFIGMYGDCIQVTLHVY